MRKAALCWVLGASSLFVVSGEARAWSEATHAYIADHIGKASGLRNYSEMYGAMAPDLFNTKQFGEAVDPELYQCIRSYTHGFYPYDVDDFMAIWQSANWGLKKNAAYGYVSHNDYWGADLAAHWFGYTSSDPNMGWVMERAHVLIDELDAEHVWEDLGLPLEQPADPWAFQPVELLCQYLVMKAGDAIIKRNDPMIGAKVAMAALLRPPAFNALLESAIPCGEDGLVGVTELEFRQNTIALGLALMLPEQQYLDTVSAQLTALAPDFLAANGVTYTPALDPVIAKVTTDGLGRAVELIEADYMDEIDAILTHLEGVMAAHGVAY